MAPTRLPALPSPGAATPSAAPLRARDPAPPRRPSRSLAPSQAGGCSTAGKQVPHLRGAENKPSGLGGGGATPPCSTCGESPGLSWEGSPRLAEKTKKTGSEGRQTPRRCPFSADARHARPGRVLAAGTTFSLEPIASPLRAKTSEAPSSIPSLMSLYLFDPRAFTPTPGVGETRNPQVGSRSPGRRLARSRHACSPPGPASRSLRPWRPGCAAGRARPRETRGGGALGVWWGALRNALSPHIGLVRQ